jgi:hypothetical protein
MSWHLFADKYPLWRRHGNQLLGLSNNEIFRKF